MSSHPISLPCSPSWHDLVRSWLRDLPSGEGFPGRDHLWWGAVRGTLAQVASGSGADQRWDGPNYVVDYQGGDVGVVTFAGEQVIGLFFAHRDDRSPWPPGSPPYDIRPYLAGIPAELRALLREQSLPAIAMRTTATPEPYLVVPADLNGPVRRTADEVWMAPITAACWGTGSRCTAAEPWAEVFEHGGYQLRTQLMEPQASLADWQDRFHLSAATIEMIWDYFTRRRLDPEGSMTMTGAEWELLERDARIEHEEWLRSTGWSLPEWRRETVEREHVDWASQMLAAIGITLA